MISLVRHSIVGVVILEGGSFTSKPSLVSCQVMMMMDDFPEEEFKTSYWHSHDTC